MKGSSNLGCRKPCNCKNRFAGCSKVMHLLFNMHGERRRRLRAADSSSSSCLLLCCSSCCLLLSTNAHRAGGRRQRLELEGAAGRAQAQQAGRAQRAQQEVGAAQRPRLPRRQQLELAVDFERVGLAVAAQRLPLPRLQGVEWKEGEGCRLRCGMQGR